jgi:hypothetical protein
VAQINSVEMGFRPSARGLCDVTDDRTGHNFQLYRGLLHGGCGAAPFGNVTLTQNGANVDVTVHLLSAQAFVKTGALDSQAFAFNATGVVLADITIDAHVPILAVSNGASKGGIGAFGLSINCPTCGNGTKGSFTGDIVFHVANAVIADLTAPNALGLVFVADVLGATGNTGVVGATTVAVPGPVVGAGLPALLFVGGSLLVFARRRRRANIAPLA